MDKIIAFALSYSPFFWLGWAIVLILIEAATVDLVAIWFSLGAIVTILPAYIGCDFRLQLFIFFATSGILIIFTRPLMKKKLMVKNMPTNADRNIGQIGKVIATIDNSNDVGRVHLDGLDWSARTEDGEVIEVGEQVLIKSIQGVKVIVERLY